MRAESINLVEHALSHLTAGKINISNNFQGYQIQLVMASKNNNHVPIRKYVYELSSVSRCCVVSCFVIYPPLTRILEIGRRPFSSMLPASSTHLRLFSYRPMYHCASKGNQFSPYLTASYRGPRIPTASHSYHFSMLCRLFPVVREVLLRVREEVYASPPRIIAERMCEFASVYLKVVRVLQLR